MDRLEYFLSRFNVLKTMLRNLPFNILNFYKRVFYEVYLTTVAKAERRTTAIVCFSIMFVVGMIAMSSRLLNFCVYTCHSVRAGHKYQTHND